MFSMVGNAVGVDVLLHSVDGRMLEPRELDLPLWFGECAPGAGFSKTVSVRNTTKLPFAFEWGLTKWVLRERAGYGSPGSCRRDGVAMHLLRPCRVPGTC